MHTAKRRWSVAALSLFAASVSLTGTAFANPAYAAVGSSVIVTTGQSVAETTPDIGRIQPNKICCNPLSPGCAPCP